LAEFLQRICGTCPSRYGWDGEIHAAIGGPMEMPR
jgi:hypothetical protein